MSDALPIGTVTFLFTDVEGSTRLLDELGPDGYAVELGRHREIVREALVTHRGVEVDTQGDAFFCAFGSARDAVVCAGAIRDALASGPVHVRMGIHTGEALVVDRHYVGIDVHRAARIGACGHGGQVVLSPTTVTLLEPGEVELRDLGPHRLKDLAAPVVLHQLGSDDFPALKTLYRTNLPIPATQFLGREPELAELVERASAPGVRALTLTGPGGTGKTRLSLQVAAELSDSFPDGVWWVPLAPLRGSELVASAVASVLDVEEEAGRSLVASIAAALGRKRALVLLDNCEHVVDAVAEIVATIAASCPDVLVLSTSRESLAIAGEQVYPVLPLVDGDAVELFLARARAVGAQLDADAERLVVTELCARLDNLPLAVELAAARAAVLPPGALLERLSLRLDALSGPRDAEERQRTLRATITWSYDLLTERERVLFRGLGAFVGGASLPAIEAVCVADLDDLFSLVSKSLVRQTSADGTAPRYWMLETILELAAEELEASGERKLLRDRHLDWFAAVGEDALALDSAQQLTRLEPDLANLREAFVWSLARTRVADAVTLARALEARHFLRGRYADAEDVLLRALELELDALDAALLQDHLGVVLRLQGRPLEALGSFREAERVLGAAASRDARWWERWIDLRLDEAHFFYFQNEPDALDEVVRDIESSIAEQGTPAQQLEILHVQAQQRYRVERYVLSDETEALARRLRASALAAGDVSADFSLGFCLLWREKPAEALTYLERGREVARAGGVALIEMRCLVYGLLALRKLADVESARARVAELREFDELHGYVGVVSASEAWVAYRDGDLELVTRHAENALADWRSPGRIGSSVFQWTARFPLLGVALSQGDLSAAREQALAMLDPSQQPLPEELAGALERAVAEGGGEAFAHALDLARPGGWV